MKTRAAKFVVALIASILSSASAFAAPEEAEQRPDTCLTSPREYSPPGSRWRYRTERGTGRHCWFLKDDVEKSASKAAEPAAAEEPAPASRKKPARTRTVSDARAELSQVAVEPETRPEPAQSAPAAAASASAATDSNQPSTVRSANMLAPAAATRWPDPMSTTNSAANPPAAPAAPADQSAERTPPAAATTPAKQQAMPRAVPPMPLSEKPMSLPMLITVIVGGLSVIGVLVSMLFSWLAARRARLSPSAPMPPLEMPDQQLRPGDLYRERQRRRTQRGGRRAA